MFWAIDEFGASTGQNASYFTLRNKDVQIVVLDTAILNNQQYTPTILPFLPDDQNQWLQAQLAYGKTNGLKTILMRCAS